jgi:hypothetical protein
MLLDLAKDVVHLAHYDSSMYISLPHLQTVVNIHKHPDLDSPIAHPVPSLHVRASYSSVHSILSEEARMLDLVYWDLPMPDAATTVRSWGLLQPQAAALDMVPC